MSKTASSSVSSCWSFATVQVSHNCTYNMKSNIYWYLVALLTEWVASSPYAAKSVPACPLFGLINRDDRDSNLHLWPPANCWTTRQRTVVLPVSVMAL